MPKKRQEDHETVGDYYDHPEVVSFLRAIGCTDQQIKDFSCRCPWCGRGFLSFPFGWGWRSHLVSCAQEHGAVPRE